jgi:hypothetical protein
MTATTPMIPQDTPVLEASDGELDVDDVDAMLGRAGSGSRESPA